MLRIFENFQKRRREESPPPGASAAEEADEGLVLWDYHVFLVAEGEGGEGSFVLDLDTTLPFPCRFSEYATLALRGEEGMAPEYHRYFRVVRAREFIRRFSSDRCGFEKKQLALQETKHVHLCFYSRTTLGATC